MEKEPVQVELGKINEAKRVVGSLLAKLPYLVSQIRKGDLIKMASVEKFTAKAVLNQIRHIERTIREPSNADIDPARLEDDYLLSPDRGMTSYDYYKQRLSELYCYGRDDVNTLCGWVITAPKELKPEDEDAFFKATYDFLVERYGEKNCISCAVHKDEAGETGHLHFLFIPCAEDKKHLDYDGKVCANSVLDRRELRNFHPDFQKHLDNVGINAKVMTGITAKQGGNRTVREMKQEREQERSRELSRW